MTQGLSQTIIALRDNFMLGRSQIKPCTGEKALKWAPLSCTGWSVSQQIEVTTVSQQSSLLAGGVNGSRSVVTAGFTVLFRTMTQHPLPKVCILRPRADKWTTVAFPVTMGMIANNA